ncbi:MAG: flagellar basal body-associated FliL family protein [Terriglobia bacterium]
MATEETNETKSTPQASNAVPPKSKLNLILIILLALTLGGTGFFGWQYFKGKQANASNHEETKESPHHEAAKGSGEKEKIDVAGHATGAPMATINFEPFLVNLADKDDSRYLKATIRVVVVDKETAEKITAGDVLLPRMRDCILTILSTKVANEMVTIEGKEKLKKEIIQKLNSILPNEPAQEVFFTDFVVQL